MTGKSATSAKVKAKFQPVVNTHCNTRLAAKKKAAHFRSGLPKDRLTFEVQEAGAQGYVLVIRAIDSLINGKTFFGSLPEENNQKKPDPNPGMLLCRAFAFA